MSLVLKHTIYFSIVLKPIDGHIGKIKMAISQEPLDLQNSKPGTNT